ncbi:MAG TPA: hypothetical protein VK763_09900 [Terriglobales bacterium]|jgi:hypothetical protein|nr:hypothetical protein [Terriglobales bacterium]
MIRTLEIKAEHRTALSALAARRGEKGISGVLAEAIEVYLRGESARDSRREELLSLAGSLSPEEAAGLRNVTTALRENW